jgi:hypothetical protein
MRGRSSDLGTVRFNPFTFAMRRTPNPPKNRQRVRNVQTGISRSPTFMIGQLEPQKIDRKISKTTPNWGRVSVAASLGFIGSVI